MEDTHTHAPDARGIGGHQTMNDDETEPTGQILARNLRALMAARGLTQRRLAERAGVAQGSISSLCNYRTKGVAPTITTVIALADALRVEPWQLLLPDLDAARPPPPPTQACALDVETLATVTAHLNEVIEMSGEPMSPEQFAPLLALVYAEYVDTGHLMSPTMVRAFRAK